MIRAPVGSLGLLMAAAMLAGAQTARVSVGPESRLWIEGTSNVRGWSCKATDMDAAIDVDALSPDLAAAPSRLLRGVQVRVPVRAMKCGLGVMDGNLYKALNAGVAEASYIVATFDAAPEATSDSTLRMVGTLEIAGVTNRIEMEIVATRQPDGTFAAAGTMPLRMTDYGITPPTAVFGRIKTGNDVKVRFDFTLRPQAIATAAEK